jgi:hypothetical protein
MILAVFVKLNLTIRYAMLYNARIGEIEIAMSSTQEITQLNIPESWNVRFRSDILSCLKLVPKNIFLKSGDYRFVCTLDSVNENGMRVITPLSTMLEDIVSKNEGLVSIRLTFTNKSNIDIDFVLSSLELYQPDATYSLLNLQYTGTGKSDMLVVLTPLLYALQEVTYRNTARLFIQEKTAEQYGIDFDECTVLLKDDSDHRCYLRDLSLSGAGFLISAQLPITKGEVLTLFLGLTQNRLPIELIGEVVRCEPYLESPDLLWVGISINPAFTSLSYIVLIDEGIKNLLLASHDLPLSS